MSGKSKKQPSEEEIKKHQERLRVNLQKRAEIEEKENQRRQLEREGEQKKE